MNLRFVTGAALLSSLALAAPAPAPAHNRHQRPHFGNGVPSRVAVPLVRATRALDRAEERIDDGETTRAATQLKTTRRSLAAAVKAAKRRLGSDSGPWLATVLASVDHKVILETSSLYDGQTGAVVDALNATLTAALDARDQLGAAVSGLGDDSLGDFEDFLDRVVDDAGDETATLTEAREDDEIAAAGDAALATALDRIAATEQAAQTRLDALEEARAAEKASYDDASDDDWYRWRHHRRHHYR